MNKEQKAFLLLIKSAFTSEKYFLDEKVDLRIIFSIAEKHGLTSLIYSGAHNCGLLNSEEISQNAFSLVCKNMVMSEIQMFAYEEMISEFEKGDVHYLPLKGVRLKYLYPKPEMRTMSDIDILIKIKQYDKIKEIMVALGYQPVVESDHELIWRRKNVTVELHKRLIPSYNKDYFAYFGDGWQLAHEKEENSNEYCLKAEDEFVFIFLHMAKHYRDAGVGIKHILDVWVFMNSNKKLNYDYIKDQLIKLKVYEFYQNVTKMLDTWFNGEEESDITNYVTNAVFNGGVFSTEEAKVLSATLKGVKEGNSVKDLKRKRFFTSIFTPYKIMCDFYPFLKKCAILLPFMWVYHLFRRLFTKGKLKNYRKQISEMQDDKVDAYKKSLNYVGLDYNFGVEQED